MKWRELGSIPKARFLQLLSGSPLAVEAADIWAAVKTNSLLYYAHLVVESNVGRSALAKSNHNPTGLRPRGGDGFMDFDTFTEAAQEWFSRVTDPHYAYAPTTTVEQYIHTYAPSSDGNNEAEYVASIMKVYADEGGNFVPTAPLTFGKVPYPAVTKSPLPANNPMVETEGAPDVPDAVVLHRMVGFLHGTDEYFHQGNAATCYGVGCLAADGADSAGQIIEWIAPRTGWYGESSGPVSAPYGDGALLVAKVGINSVNRVTKAIEISGNYDTALDDACIESVVNLVAYWADQKRIPWSEFPNVPGENRSFVVWHQELTIGTGKICPGPVVMSATPDIIARVAQRLKEYQVGGIVVKPTAYTPLVLGPWWAESLASAHPTDQTWNGWKLKACRRNEVCDVQTSRLSAPTPTAGKSGPPVKKGEKVFMERWVVGDNGQLFWQSIEGHYMLASKFSPKVTIV